MAIQNYSISEAQDLVLNMKAVSVFIDSGVPENHLPPEVMTALLDYLSSSVCILESALCSKS